MKDMIDTVICGDCLEVMRGMNDNSVDSVITDPPYGLGFMGKGWDHGVPGVPYWSECLRVAKPGAILMAFGGTRTFHRLTCAIEDAGWEIRDCIQWIYGSGFPKSLDISKAIDKAAGAEQEPTGKIKAGHEGFANRGNLSSVQSFKGTLGGEGGFSRPWMDDPEKVEAYHQDTAPATELAQLWDGWGTALKPSWEPIIVAMKPLDGTFAQNAEKWGVAGLWIDGGRIGTEERFNSPATAKKGTFNCSFEDGYAGQTVQGRFPANTILDEEAAAMLDEQSGVSGGGETTQRKTPANRAKTYSGFENCSGEVNAPNNYAGVGGASRFFYCAKSSKSERNAGCEEMEAGPPPASARSKPAEGRNTALGLPRQNHHPTVKPLALMEYLCKLTKTPTGGIVLDPFAGSGTTGIAAYKTGRQYILIEKEPDYCKIAEKRIQDERDKYALFGEQE